MQKIQPAGFADLAYTEKKKQTRREKFLAKYGCHTAVEEVARVD